MEIRAVTAEDAEQVLALDRALVLDGRGEVRGPEDLRDLATYRHRLGAGGEGWVAVEQGRVLGQARFRKVPVVMARHVASCSVGVHPEAQGRGLVRALMEHVLAEAWTAGVHRLELYVRADNERAQRLYRSLGFCVESVRRDYLRTADGDFLDDLCMVRFRPDGPPW